MGRALNANRRDRRLGAYPLGGGYRVRNLNGMVIEIPSTDRPLGVTGVMLNDGAMDSRAWPNPAPAGSSLTSSHAAILPSAVTLHLITARPPWPLR